MGKDVEDILNKYKRKLEKEFDDNAFSEEYKRFKNEQIGTELSFYEKACNFSKDILAIKPKPKEKEELWESISAAGLKITPEGATSFAFFIGVGIIFLGILVFILGLLLDNVMLFLPLFLDSVPTHVDFWDYHPAWDNNGAVLPLT